MASKTTRRAPSSAPGHTAAARGPTLWKSSFREEVEERRVREERRGLHTLPLRPVESNDRPTCPRSSCDRNLLLANEPLSYQLWRAGSILSTSACACFWAVYAPAAHPTHSSSPFVDEPEPPFLRGMHTKISAGSVTKLGMESRLPIWGRALCRTTAWALTRAHAGTSDAMQAPIGLPPWPRREANGPGFGAML